MTYRLTKFDAEGRKTADLGIFANVASARQAMLDDSYTVDLPTELPFGPILNIVEGWFVGRTEYNIEAA
jgi:hypothetical protein